MTLGWIERAPHAPYFVVETGECWTPIGQNDAICWVEFDGLRHARDLPAVARHMAWLVENGVTCLRLMLEYAEHGVCFFETPAGSFDPEMVALWDNMFRLAEQAGLRILLTPLDTYFQWVHWDRHPYNAANGGPCPTRAQLMICPATRARIKARLAFATRRWGGTGTLFAWDLWNEMHPAQGEDRPDCFTDYIDDVSPFLRDLEVELHGRPHLQCVSVFGPELRWKPWLNEPIFRHPSLDFASSHFYAEGTIDAPTDTVTPAIAVGELMREALAEITDGRPFLDTEHGPIHTFKDRGITLPEAFDDEYFRHIQWTHLACGGVGGGMRWPNRNPHVLTPGMRRAQRAMADFLPLMKWSEFDRQLLGDDLTCSSPDVVLFGCRNRRVAMIYALRLRPLTPDRRIDPLASSSIDVSVSGLEPSRFNVIVWDTIAGIETSSTYMDTTGATLLICLSDFASEVAIIVRPSR